MVSCDLGHHPFSYEKINARVPMPIASFSSISLIANDGNAIAEDVFTTIRLEEAVGLKYAMT